MDGVGPCERRSGGFGLVGVGLGYALRARTTSKGFKDDSDWSESIMRLSRERKVVLVPTSTSLLHTNRFGFRCGKRQRRPRRRSRCWCPSCTAPFSTRKRSKLQWRFTSPTRSVPFSLLGFFCPAFTNRHFCTIFEAKLARTYDAVTPVFVLSIITPGCKFLSKYMLAKVQ